MAARNVYVAVGLARVQQWIIGNSVYRFSHACESSTDHDAKGQTQKAGFIIIIIIIIILIGATFKSA
jgi:hypothetical protein